jgi:hypothetical protein
MNHLFFIRVVNIDHSIIISYKNIILYEIGNFNNLMQSENHQEKILDKRHLGYRFDKSHLVSVFDGYRNSRYLFLYFYFIIGKSKALT